MSMLQQATDGRMLHRMWRGLRPEPMKCKNCGDDFAWFEGDGGFNGWNVCRECEQ